MQESRVRHVAPLLAFSILFLLACARTIPLRHAKAERGAYPIPLVHAHAHNDYNHPHPLFDALARCFTSIEADIHLVDGKLLVAHDRDQTKPDRTLQSLYLDPLRALVHRHRGRVYPEWPQVTLLVDIKTDADSTYRVLRDVLSAYRDILTVFTPQKRIDGPVMVIISGNRPFALMAREKVRYAALDGRLSDLDRDVPATLMPLISDKWTEYFSWLGAGAMPDSEQQKLTDIVRKAHQRGQRIRFWGTPDDSTQARYRFWQEFLQVGVDLINTDDLPALRDFLLKR